MLKRQTADTFVKQVQERAAVINKGPYAWKIERIEVFGSYLTDKAVLGDLDLMVTMHPRYEDQDQFTAILEDRRRAAEQSGKSFNSYLDRICWPTEEIHRALRGRNYSISIHTQHERPHLSGSFKTIYQE